MDTFKSNSQGVSNKLKLDQYYTPKETAEYCFKTLLEHIEEPLDDIVFLEPSAGEGVFLDIASNHSSRVFGVDIQPKHPNVVESDFLTMDTTYYLDKGVVTFGNPPFGSRLSLAIKFYNKATEFSDYIAFILPISQLNNINSMYKFDLIHSEDLGNVIFSGEKSVHCCFNIYKKPTGGLNKKPTNRLKDVKFIRNDSKNYATAPYDLLLCYWGDGSGGKLVEDPFKHAGTYKIQVLNPDILNDVTEALTTVNWKEELKSTAMVKIQIHHIVNLLKRSVEGIS